MKRWLTREWSYLRGGYDKWQRDDGALMAAAVAYYVGLSILPLLVVLIAGFGLFLKYTHLGQSAEDHVLAVLAEQLSPALRNNVREALATVKNQSPITGPIGVTGLLIAVIIAIGQFQRAFHRIWSIPEPASQGILASIREILITHGIAFLMLLAMGVLVLAVFLVGLALSATEAFTGQVVHAPDAVWGTVDSLLGPVLNILIFTLLYRWLPKVPVLWKEALRGGIFTAVGWEIGRQLLSSFLIGRRYTNAYGVIGSFIAIQLWCYYAAALIFLGAEYIQQFCHSCKDTGRASHLHESVVRLEAKGHVERQDHSQPVAKPPVS